METKKHVGFAMKIIGTIALAFAIGWSIRDFGATALYYALAIAGFTATIFLGFHIDHKTEG